MGKSSKTKQFFEEDQIFEENGEDSSKGIEDAEEDLEHHYDNR